MKNIINTLKTFDYRGWTFLIVGILLIIGSVLGGLYVTFFVCIGGGIIDIVHGVQANPMEAGKIAFGVVKFMIASISGVMTFLVGMFFTKFFIDKA